MLNYRILAASGTLATLLLFTNPGASAQPDPPPFHVQTVTVQSGVFENKTATLVDAFSETIRIKGAAWLHFYFDEPYLGTHSYLTLRSLRDGGVQRHTAGTMAGWSNRSAVFNGDAVEIILHVAPGDTGVHFSIATALVGEFSKKDEPYIKSLCGGDDDRGPSTNPRVGRLFFGGCTAWLTANSSFVTAGHCCDLDPDDLGPLLPDGVLDLSGVVEFNIPESQDDGTVVAAAPDDQYPIVTSNVTWEFPGGGGDMGDDWCVFEVGANSNTGLWPWQPQSFFRVAAYQPDDDATVRITACGRDETPPGSTGGANSDNKTLQTANGPFKGVDINGAKITLKYRVDMTPATSGGPVIYDATGVAIGINTNSGCNEWPWSYNHGTAIGKANLAATISEFLGASTRYVDKGHPQSSGTGSAFNPYLSAANGVSGIPSGWDLCIVEGTYDETMTITKAMTLRAPVGTVFIGLSSTPSLEADSPAPSVPETNDEQPAE